MKQANNKNKTLMFNENEKELKWFLLDAEGKTLGRFAAEIAKILRGKHKPTFTPHANLGDGIVVVNVEKIKVSGNKEGQKVYRHYTGFVSGLKEIPYRRMQERHPDYILKHAVKGMLPKTKQGRAMLKKLRIFVGEDHSMKAQKPIKLDI